MDLPPRIVLASANPSKAAELAEVLAGEFGASGAQVELVPRPPDVGEVPEDAPDFEGNARLKASALCAATGLPALADDSGLEVDGLGGAPGVRSARFAGDEADDAMNLARLCDELQQLPEGAAGRRARFRCVVVLRLPDGAEVMAEGSVEGHIVSTPRGRGGFGYDPVFVADEGDGRTFAEMSAPEKHSISHRGRALRALIGELGGC